jgi:hypothetical protein
MRSQDRLTDIRTRSLLSFNLGTTRIEKRRFKALCGRTAAATAATKAVNCRKAARPEKKKRSRRRRRKEREKEGAVGWQN